MPCRRAGREHSSTKVDECERPKELVGCFGHSFRKSALSELPDPKDKESPEKKRMEQLLDLYHDVLLPKVCGVQRWGPKNRRTGCISTHGTALGKGDLDPCVECNDEAFLVLLWENCFSKWTYTNQHKRAGTTAETDPEVEPKLKTPYTNAKGGQKRFGQVKTKK